MKKLFTAILTVTLTAGVAQAADIVFQGSLKPTTDQLPAPEVLVNNGMNLDDGREMLGEKGDLLKLSYSQYQEGNYPHVIYNVKAAVAGEYELMVSYATMNQRYFYVKVGDNQATVVKTYDSNGWGWTDATSQATMHVWLNEGDNEMLVSLAPMFIGGSRSAYYMPGIYKFEFNKVSDGTLTAADGLANVFVEAESCITHTSGIENRSGFHTTEGIAGSGVGLDNGNTATYSVDVEANGIYLMRIWYCSMQTRNLSVEVENYPAYLLNGTPGTTDNWDTANNMVMMPVYLEKGTNNLTLKGHDGNAPIVDCFEFEKVSADWFDVPAKLVEPLKEITVLARDYDNPDSFGLSLSTDCLGEKSKVGTTYDRYVANGYMSGAHYTFNAEKAGVYTLECYYATGDTRYFYVRVNDKKGYSVQATSNGSWGKDLASATGVKTMTVWLNEGENTLVVAESHDPYMPGVAKFVFTEDPISGLTEADFEDVTRYFGEFEDYYYSENVGVESSEGHHGGLSAGFDNEQAVAYYAVNVPAAGKYQLRFWHRIAANGIRDFNFRVLGKVGSNIQARDNSGDWGKSEGMGAAVVELNAGVNIFAVAHGETQFSIPADCFEFEPIEASWHAVGTEELIAEASPADADVASFAVEPAVENFDNTEAIFDHNEYNLAVANAAEASVTVVFDRAVDLQKVVWASATKGRENWVVSASADGEEYTPVEVAESGTMSAGKLSCWITPATQGEGVTCVKLNMTADKAENLTLGNFEVHATEANGGTTSASEAVAAVFAVSVSGCDVDIIAAAGLPYAIYGVNGTKAAAGIVGEDGSTVSLVPGAYIVKVADAACKVIVK